MSEVRQLAARKCGGRCSYCGKEVTDKTAVMEHLIPISRGGATGSRNTTGACHSCNMLKRSRTPDEYKDKIRQTVSAALAKYGDIVFMVAGRRIKPSTLLRAKIRFYNEMTDYHKQSIPPDLAPFYIHNEY